MTLRGSILTRPRSADPLLADIVEEVTARLQAGEVIDWEGYAQRYPDKADQLRALLPALQMLAEAASSGAARSTIDRASATHPALVAGVLGDYRLGRELGRGGMGVVYQAEQISLKRTVALKVLPFAAMLDQRQLQRFQTEAQAAACLHHPHIVPVYAVGHERGVHYYAMQYIDGQSLEALLRELRRLGSRHKPTNSGGPAVTTIAPLAALSTEGSIKTRAYFRTVARLGLEAAEALEHAHQSGILHRDIKPANLLLDQRGNLWITDFGLARCRGEGDVTRTGDLLGTLRCMSPEQALAKPNLVDQRADLYSLGATLYELLTLEPVFPGNDRQRLLRQIADEEPKPPRHRNRAIPVELETIVLKALAKAPAERYTTAQALADDLRRFLEDKAILARRPSIVEKVRRWARRHKGIVVAGLSVVVVCLGVLAVSNLRVARQRDEAEAKRRVAREAVDVMYTEFAQKWLSEQPQLEPMQQHFLLKALNLYEQFAREQSADPDVQLEAAKAYHRVADIHYRLGHLSNAEAAYDLALAHLNQLLESPVARLDLRRQLASCSNDRGHCVRDAGRWSEAEQAYRKARTLYAQLGDERPEDRECWTGLAGSSNNLALVLTAQRRYQEAEKVYRQAVTILTHLSAKVAQGPGLRHDLAACQSNLAGLLRDTGQSREAEQLYQASLAGWDKLTDEYPDRPHYRAGQASTLHGAGMLLATLDRLTDAETAYQKALSLRERLAADFPRVPAYRVARATTLGRLGFVLAATSRPQVAESCYRKAIDLLEPLHADPDAVPAHRLELAGVLHDLAGLLQATSRNQQAAEAYGRVVGLVQSLIASRADVLEYRWLLSSIQKEQGSLFAVAGQLAEARKALLDALVLKERLVQEEPAAGYRSDLAWLLATAPLATFRDPSRALELARQAVEQAPGDGRSWLVFGVASYRAASWSEARAALQKARGLPHGDTAATWLFLAMAHRKLGDRFQARRCYESASAWIARHLLLSEEVQRFRAEAAALLGMPRPSPGSRPDTTAPCGAKEEFREMKGWYHRPVVL
jgi:serine/threonine protein kinase